MTPIQKALAYCPEESRSSFELLLKKLIMDAYNQGYRDGEATEGSVFTSIDVSEWSDAEIYYTQLTTPDNGGK